MHSRLLTLARDSRLALTITILSGFLAGLLIIWQAWLLSNTIHSIFLESQTLAQVWGWIRLLLIVIAGRALLAWVSDVSANAVAIRVKSDLRQRLFNHILALGPAHTRKLRSGELTAAAIEGVEALDAYFSQYLPQLILSALIPVSILVFVFPLDPLSGLVLLITAPLIPFFMILIGKGAEIVTDRQYKTLSRLSAHFLDSLQGLTTLKLFGRSKDHTRTIAEVSDQFRDTTLSVLRVTFLSALVLELLATLSTAVVAVEIGLRLLYYRLNFVEALFILVIAPEFYIPLRMLGQRFHAGMAGTSAARRIFEILDLKSSEHRTASSQTTMLCPPRSIQFKSISYTYPGETVPALQDISLQIYAGQHTALVGPSGAGKSTLVNLLLRFFQPENGQITVNNQPLEDIDIDFWRAQVAWVPQKPYLFHDTIAANIRLGKTEAGMDEVVAAAQSAHLHEFVQTLPAGYETVIGEGGARLSSGQAQRLALARAFLKDAPILILDEPTSSLDPQNEVLLEESTRRLLQGYTACSAQSRIVITIAHRLNTVFQADKIVVLENGQIVEQGTHSQLLAKNGAYAGMVNALKVENRKSNASPVPGEFYDNEAAIPRSNPKQAFSPQTATKPQTETPNRKSPVLLRLLAFLAGSWNWVVLSVLLGTFTIGSAVALMGTSAWLISTAALHPSIAELQVAIVGVRFFGISRGVFRYLERLVSHNVTFRLLAKLRTWFYEKIEPLAPARLIAYRAGDLLARIVSDVETLENFYVRVVAPPLVAVLITLGTSIFLGSYDPQLGYALLSFLLGLGLGIPLLTQTISRRPGADLVVRRSDLHVQLVDGIQGLADLLVFGRAADRREQIAATDRAYGRAQRRMAWISGLHTALGSLLTNLGMWTVLVLAIPLVSSGQIDGVALATLTLVTLASFEAVNPLPLAAQMWSSTSRAARRLFEVVDTEPAVSERKERRKTSSPEKMLVPSVEFSNLTFAYPGQDIAALQDISFTLPSHHSLAIVGPSGAGKSTLAHLLLRFWEFEQGEIRLGGESLHNFTMDEARSMFALVSQNAYFFNGSVLENLRLARPSATQQEIETVAQQAKIHDFILSLPKGYNTFIGEQGLRLSGGERQRLAIARALLKDAPILILDEPTANLDPLTEKQVLETLFELIGSLTMVLITHRLVGLERFDEIIVLEQGRIVERGQHQTLLANNGLYRQMWDLQNRLLSDPVTLNGF